MLKEFNLEGKSAIVTGAGRGIGRVIALTLAEAGADVAVVARSAKELEETAREVRLLGRKSLAIPTDITKTEDITRMVDKTIQELGKIDILVNNAGMVLVKPMLPDPSQKVLGADKATDLTTPITEEEWRRVVDLNLTALFLCSRIVAAHMMQRKKGKIINITSGYADQGGRSQRALRRQQGGRGHVHQDSGSRMGSIQHQRQCHRTRVDPHRPVGGILPG